MAKRDMIFCVLFIGDEQLVRHLILDSIKRLGALSDWEQGIWQASLVRLRVIFFLLMDRDPSLKQKILDGWPDICVVGIEPNKANAFFQQLRVEVIDPWLVDERKCEDEFVSGVVDLYLVS